MQKVNMDNDIKQGVGEVERGQREGVQWKTIRDIDEENLG